MDSQQPKNVSLARFAALIVALLAVLVAYRFLDGGGQQEPGNAPVTGESVTIAIDRGDGEKLIETPVDWHEGMTVVDAMHQASAAGSFDFESQGRGEGALVTHIDGVANGGANGQNWIFDVNGEQAQVGVGAYQLKSGDRVLWRFAAYE